MAPASRHLAAFRAHDGRPPVGVTVVEGEEESGSSSLSALLAAHQGQTRRRRDRDRRLVNWTADIPALTALLRGLVDCVVEVATLDHGLHSGLWGGVVPDALAVLVRLLASLHDEDGNVAVSGLHEIRGARRPRTRLGPCVESGLLDGVSEIGNGSVAQRMWAKPAITSSASTPPRSHRRRTP